MDDPADNDTPPARRPVELRPPRPRLERLPAPEGLPGAQPPAPAVTQPAAVQPAAAPAEQAPVDGVPSVGEEPTVISSAPTAAAQPAAPAPVAAAAEVAAVPPAMDGPESMRNRSVTYRVPFTLELQVRYVAHRLMATDSSKNDVAAAVLQLGLEALGDLDAVTSETIQQVKGRITEATEAQRRLAR